MKEKDALSDEDLVHMIVQQDSMNAFSILYNRYWDILWRYAANMMKSADDAGDVVQDVFAAFWEKRSTLQIHTSVSAFLYRSILNRVITLSNRSKYAEQYAETLKDALNNGDFTTDNDVLEKEMIRRFEEGLEKLPNRMREVFEYSRFEEMTHKEIAQRMDIAPETVKRQIKNALKLLKNWLNTNISHINRFFLLFICP